MAAVRAQWPDGTGALFDQYCGATTSDAAGLDPETAPYWLHVPLHLVVEAADRPGGLPASEFRAAGRLAWAQYCLFLFVRMHDDLYDRHVDDPRLAVLADRFLVQGARTYRRACGDDGPAWERFWDGLDSCLSAIVELDRLARKPGVLRREHASLIAAVNGVLALGPTAIAARLGHDAQAVAKCCDGLGVVGQLMDDLSDLEDDLAAGRHTIVANLLSSDGFEAPAASVEAAVVAGLVQGRASRVFELADEWLAAARTAAERISSPWLQRHMEERADALRRRAAGVHRGRVIALIGDDLAP